MNGNKGKMVVFWSPWDTGNLTSSCLAAITAEMQNKTGDLIAVTNILRLKPGVEQMLCHIQNCDLMMGDKKSGMAALTFNFKQAKLNDDRITCCGIPLKNSNIHLFPGISIDTKSTDNQGIQEMFDILPFLLSTKMTEVYEWVFVELPGGVSELSQKLMNKADIVAVVLPQNPNLWREYFTSNTMKNEDKPMLYIVGDYLPASKFNKHYFSIRFHNQLRRAVFGVVPNSTGYKDACMEGKGIEFFMQHSYAKKKEENAAFVSEIRNIVQLLLNLGRSTTRKHVLEEQEEIDARQHILGKREEIDARQCVLMEREGNIICGE